jgi:hypothetical protein
MEFQCRVIVQRRSAPSCGSPVENIPLQAERHSGRRQKLFAFPPESAFTFRPECCSESQRNRVQLQAGIAFTFDRISHLVRSSKEGQRQSHSPRQSVFSALDILPFESCGSPKRCARYTSTTSFYLAYRLRLEIAG